MNNNELSQLINQSRSLSLPSNVTNPAKWTYERLVDYINDFEKDLDDKHEIGARLVSFGSTITFHIQDIGYWGPDIISFTGFDDNLQKVQLIQNTSQLSVLLIAVAKQEDKARRIGFKLKEKITDD